MFVGDGGVVVGVDWRSSRASVFFQKCTSDVEALEVQHGHSAPEAIALRNRNWFHREDIEPPVWLAGVVV